MAEAFDPYYEWLGIAPEDQPPDLYRLLAIRTFEDKPSVIESAADQRMGHLRTFQAGKRSAQSQKLLNQVSSARVTLLNPEKKAKYDELLRERMRLESESVLDDESASRHEEISTTLVGFLEAIEVSKLKEAAKEAKKKPASAGPQPSKAVSEEAGGERKLMIAGAAGVGVLLLLVIGVLAWKLGGGQDEKRQPVAGVPQGPQQPVPAPVPKPTEPRPPKPVPDEGPRKPPDGPSGDVEPEPPDQKPPEVPPEEKPPGETVAATDPTTPKPETPKPETPNVEPNAKPPAEQKLPVPSLADQEKMARQFDDVYKLSQKRTAEEDVELAKRLFGLGKESQGGPVEKFVYFRKAMEIACRGGDPAMMLEVVDAMGQQFDLDTLEGKQKMLATFVSGKPEAQRIVAFMDAGDTVIDEAIDAGRHDIALSIADAAYGLCRDVRDRDLRKRAYDRRNDVRKMAEQFKELGAAQEALKANPDDPAANLAVGRWFCFQRGLWERGLPHLAKCSSPTLKTVAAEELDSPPTDPEEQVRLADTWWLLSEKVESTEKNALMLHAGEWYERAAGELPKGFTKDKVSSRVAEIAKIAESSPEKPGRPKRPKEPKIPKELAIDLPGGVKMEFVLIPPGEFVMGSPEAERALALEQAKAHNDKWAIERIPTEGPQHKLKITKPFYLGKYEVTQAQWEAAMGNNPSQFNGPLNPVEKVSWEDVQQFLAKINAAFEKQGMLFGLPTEAGWEYACRAGTTTAFYFGDNPALLAQHGWFKDNSGGKTHPVGQGQPNAWGLYDMHGNVWEWCSDWYAKDFYAQSPPVDPVGPPTGSYRVYRGGGWHHHPERCRSAYRSCHSPGHRYHDLGFRLALVRLGK